MCIQNMENTDTKSKKMDKNILDLFWNLTSKNVNQRIDTCSGILRLLYKKQEQEGDYLSVELKYCLERLIKGLASSRDAARLGYSLLLTEILKQFPVLEIEDVLQHMKKHLAITPKQEKRDIVFGQLFTYSSIIRSGRLADHPHLSFITLSIFDLWQGRNFILNACYTIVTELFNQLSSEKFGQEIWPHLKEKFSGGWKKSSPDTLWLLSLVMRFFPDVVKEKYLKKHYNSASIFSLENADHLKKIIRQTTSSLPKIHPLCSEISIMCGTSKEVKGIWNVLVDDTLFETDQSEKSFVGFLMVKCVLETTKKKKIVKTVLSTKLRSLFARSFINMKSPMNPAATQLAEYLSKFAIATDSSDIQMLVLKFFLTPPDTMSFDQIVKKKEVSSLIQNLLPESIKMYYEFLKDIALKKQPDRGEEFLSDTRRCIAIAQMGNLVLHLKVGMDIEWKMNVIKFLFLHSFFSIKKITPDILHCEEENLPPKLKESCMDAFFKSLSSLYQRAEQQTPLQHSLQHLCELLEYADELMAASEYVTSNFNLEEVQESWLIMKTMVHKLKKQSKKDGKINETNAFLALFLELGFHLFHDTKHISEVLEELRVCCKKALSDRKHVLDNADSDNEPPWVGVVTDIMLSLLSRPSTHLRRLVTSVFQLLCPFITQEALQQILSVINPDKAEDEAMLVNESDDEELNFESGSSSDESDSNELNDGSKGDLLFKEKVREALGAAADASDVESVVLSDTEMFRLDDALSKAFQGRVQVGHTQMKSEDKTMLEFRLRCLDLIITYLKSGPPMYLTLQCIKPILAAYEFSHKNEHQKHFLRKIVSTIETMTKIKKFQNFDNVEKSELKEILKMLITKCQKEVNLEVAKKLYSLCVFVVLCFRRFESHHTDKKSTKTPSYLKMYLSALDDFAKGNNSSVYPQFFVSVIEACPDLAWHVTEVCQNYAFDENIRMYRKTQCLGILYEAIKFAKTQDTIDVTQWSDFCETLVPKVNEALKITLQDLDVKPAYLTELLNVIYVCHLSFQEKTSQSLLEKHKDLLPYLCEESYNVKKRLGKKGKVIYRKVVHIMGGDIGSKTKNKLIENGLEIPINSEISTDSVSNRISIAEVEMHNDKDLVAEENIELSKSKSETNATSKKRKSISKENKKKKLKVENN